MKNFKRILSLLLAVLMTAGMLPVGALAAEPEEASESEVFTELYELPDMETSALSVSAFSLDDSGKVALKDGSYSEWIDRLDLEGAAYAVDFYEWLEENIDGALMDPVEAVTDDGLRGEYLITEFSSDHAGTVDMDLDYYDRRNAAADLVRSIASANQTAAAKYVSAVYNAFDRDHPEVFWLTGSSLISSSWSYGYNAEGVVSYTQKIYFVLQNDSFDIRQDAYCDTEVLKAAIQQREQDIQSILDQVTALDRYEQIRQLNSILTMQNCYNTNVASAGEASRECISALSGSVGTKGPVCEGYARAFKVLCNRLLIPCVLVDGQATNSAGVTGAHMWNYVQMNDGNWYAVDVTWNDPMVSGVTYAVSGHENEDFLLVGSRTVIDGMTFEESHPVSNLVSSSGTAFVNGPVLSEKAYDAEAFIPVTGVFLDKEEMELRVGESMTLTASIRPANATNQTLTWLSSDSAVAAVEDGVVTAIAPGTANIIATVEGYGDRCIVTVTEAEEEEEEECTDHTYSNGVCVRCGTVCPHNYKSFTFGGSTVTASCQICDMTNKLTLTAEGGTYNGTPYAASHQEPEGLLEGLVSEITYVSEAGESPEAPVNAGSYTAYVMVQSYKVKVSYTIKPRALEPALTGSVTKRYDGTTAVPEDNSLSIRLEGILDGDEVAATADYAYAGTAAGTTMVHASNITLSGADAENYTLSSSMISADVGMITASSGNNTGDDELISYTLNAVQASGKNPVPASSRNINKNEYSYNWAQTVKSVLAEENGGYIRAEYTGGQIIVEWYDSDYELQSAKTVELELPLFGGIYIGEDYNFVVCGQSNWDELDTNEVVRVIRYSKNWVREDAASLYGANTTVPFEAGSLRFARCGNYLYIRTSHQMYTSEDGRNHQANLTLNVRISDMTITDQFSRVLNINYGYVNHSFNQFIQTDGNALLAVDHGDAYPRAVVLTKYAQPAGQNTFTGKVTYENVLPITLGNVGDNATGVRVGGFEYSSTHYLVAGNSCDQSKGGSISAQRNIFVTATAKNALGNSKTATYWLTDYAPNANVSISNPHLVKTGADSFCLLWSVDDTVYYCMLDGMGCRTTDIFRGEGSLSDCAPILANDKIVWYVTVSDIPWFFEIALTADTEEPEETEPEETEPEVTEPEETEPEETEPEETEPEETEPEETEPEETEPEETEPEETEPEETEPEETEPEETEPEETEPEETEPEETEPEETEPEETEPEVTEPEVTEPEVTEPEVTEPEETEPEETEPEETEPEETEPEETEPEVTEPEATEPEETEPEVTEPEATEPEETEPEETEPEETEPEETEPEETLSVTRIAGKGRCQTAIMAAEKLKELKGVSKFDSIIVANAGDFPDALAGSYLAAVTDAPILLYLEGQTEVTDYIKQNISAKGIVYVLGQTDSVPASFETYLDGIASVRLAGRSRYATCLEILEKAEKLRGSKPDAVLVCTGLNFADSLSASATGMPILLVKGTDSVLTDAQLAYLEALEDAEIYVVGGRNTVSDDILQLLHAYDRNGEAERIAGSGREKTSVAVAEKFFPDATVATLAFSQKFPDGLSGGPVAYALNAPLLLISSGREATAAGYIADKQVQTGCIIGGTTSVSDESAKAVFGEACTILAE